MQIFVKTLTSQTIVCDVDPTTTVSELAQQIGLKERVPADEIRIIFRGKQLEGSRTVSEYAIQKESTVSMVLRLRGGIRPADSDSKHR